MKPVLQLEHFRQYLLLLDQKISDLRNKQDQDLLRLEYPIEIYAMGGFSLMYYGLRYSGTEDIDSAIRLQEPIKKLVREVASELQIPIDWLNDVPATRLYYSRDSYNWADSGWLFANLQLYVIELKDLLMNKLEVADKVLVQQSDRSIIRDFDDVESIVDKLGCNYQSMDELEKWFSEQGIRLMDFPNVYDKFIERLKDDGCYWPDGHV